MTTHEPGGRSRRHDVAADHDAHDHAHDHDGAPDQRGRRDHDEHDHPSRAATTSARLRGAEQLIAVLPQLIGYQIDHSVVVVAARIGGPHGRSVGQMIFTGRLDLPPPEAMSDHLDSIRTALLQADDGSPGPVLLTVVGYDLPEREPGHVDEEHVIALEAAADRLADTTGAHVHDLLLVRDEGRETYGVRRDGEHVPPPERGWRPTPPAADVPVAADLVLQGRVALPSRAALAELVRRRDEPAARATALALGILDLDPTRHDPGAMLRALTAWLTDGVPPTAGQRAGIAWTLADREVRDAVLARWLPELGWDDGLGQDGARDLCAGLAAFPGEGWREPVGRLLALAGEVPHPFDSAVLTMVAMVSWVRGDGTLANEAVDTALERDPRYTLARLLRRMLEAGLRPPRGAGVGARPDRRSGGRSPMRL
ncbi:DUF4192 domain-containing protein [Serinicoccus marinus]|uniref:DUF4192 domain-containing protein n=1 Tax=Serinicoccus marinus TaxID=247333 RepID=UPI0003B77DF1|nr:DUF4192 domain-containing protein [Serinicoccus marinus]